MIVNFIETEQGITKGYIQMYSKPNLIRNINLNMIICIFSI